MLIVLPLSTKMGEWEEGRRGGKSYRKDNCQNFSSTVSFWLKSSQSRSHLLIWYWNLETLLKLGQTFLFELCPCISYQYLSFLDICILSFWTPFQNDALRHSVVCNFDHPLVDKSSGLATHCFGCFLCVCNCLGISCNCFIVKVKALAWKFLGLLFLLWLFISCLISFSV